MKQKELRTFYLLTLPPLFLFTLIILFFDPDYLDAALFAFGYSFTLVAWTPYVEELVHTRKYRMSFLRLSYVITKKVIDSLGVKEKVFLSSLIRILLPALFMLLMMLVLQTTLNAHYTFFGALFSELLLQIFKRYLPKNVLSLS